MDCLNFYGVFVGVFSSYISQHIDMAYESSSVLLICSSHASCSWSSSLSSSDSTASAQLGRVARLNTAGLSAVISVCGWTMLSLAAGAAFSTGLGAVETMDAQVFPGLAPATAWLTSTDCCFSCFF